MAPVKLAGSPRGTVKGTSALNIVSFTLRAAPIPAPILQYILENLSILKKLQQEKKAEETGMEAEEVEAEEEEREGGHGDVVRKPTVTKGEFWQGLKAVCKEVGGEWEGIVEKIWAFGPQKAGGCLLVDNRKGSGSKSSLKGDLSRKVGEAKEEGGVRSFDSHIEAGFQLATFQGPLCSEPVEGLAYFIEQVDVDQEGLEREICEQTAPSSSLDDPYSYRSIAQLKTESLKSLAQSSRPSATPAATPSLTGLPASCSQCIRAIFNARRTYSARCTPSWRRGAGGSWRRK